MYEDVKMVEQPLEDRVQRVETENLDLKKSLMEKDTIIAYLQRTINSSEKTSATANFDVERKQFELQVEEQVTRTENVENRCKEMKQEFGTIGQELKQFYTERFDSICSQFGMGDQNLGKRQRLVENDSVSEENQLVETQTKLDQALCKIDELEAQVGKLQIDLTQERDDKTTIYEELKLSENKLVDAQKKIDKVNEDRKYSASRHDYYKKEVMKLEAEIAQLQPCSNKGDDGQSATSKIHELETRLEYERNQAEKLSRQVSDQSYFLGQIVDDFKELARNFFKKKKYEAAVGCLLEAIKFEKENHNDSTTISELYSRLSWYYLDDGRYDDALNAATKAIKYDKSNPWAYHRRAQANSRLGNKKEAISDAREALNISPNFQKARDLLSMLTR